MQPQKQVVLITEDEPSMLTILADKFMQNGFVALTAKDGEEGLRVALDKHPDVVLLDLLMPKIDGMAMMTKLRQDSWGKSVPVIILTNVSPDSDTIIKAIVDSQPAYYLVKSDVKLEEIVEKVKSILTPMEAQKTA